MPDLEAPHRELERGGGGGAGAVRLAGRHEVGDVADDEHRARPRVEDGLRGRARIAAGDDHDLRRLAVLGERAVAGALGRVAAAPEGAVAVEQRSGEVGHVGAAAAPVVISRFEPRAAPERRILAPLPACCPVPPLHRGMCAAGIFAGRPSRERPWVRRRLAGILFCGRFAPVPAGRRRTQGRTRRRAPESPAVGWRRPRTGPKPWGGAWGRKYLAPRSPLALPSPPVSGTYEHRAGSAGKRRRRVPRSEGS